MKVTNKLGLPQPLVDAVANDPYSRGDSDISVTQLIDPPRKVELTRLYADEIEEDASDRIWALFGQAIHTILERSDREGQVETTLTAEYGDWTISGTFDRMAVVEKDGQRVLQDYKTASVWEIINGVKEDREQQLNLYAWLAAQNGYEVDRLEAIFILRDWKLPEAERKANDGYPQRQVAVVEIPLWPERRLQAYLAYRVQAHYSVRGHFDDPLPECTDDERWADPAKWAVYGLTKAGKRRARATRLYAYEDLAQAERHAEQLGGTIEYRIGDPSKRCRSYCGAYQFCTQGQRLEQERQSYLEAALEESVKQAEDAAGD